MKNNVITLSQAIESNNENVIKNYPYNRMLKHFQNAVNKLFWRFTIPLILLFKNPFVDAAQTGRVNILEILYEYIPEFINSTDIVNKELLDTILRLIDCFLVAKRLPIISSFDERSYKSSKIHFPTHSIDTKGFNRGSSYFFDKFIINLTIDSLIASYCYK